MTGVSPSGIISGVSWTFTCCLSSKDDILCINSKDDLLWQDLHSTGSVIIPLFNILCSFLLHTVHLKKASFISGMTSDVLMTMPDIEINLSISSGPKSLILDFFVKSHIRTRIFT